MKGMIALMSLLWLFLLASPATRAQSDLVSDLEEAKALYREAKFAQAIGKLHAVIGRLEQLRDVQARKIQLSDAHLHLALSYVALNDPTAAKESLKQMLRADRTRKLDPDVYAPKVIELFEEARAEVAKEPPPTAAVPAPVSSPFAAPAKKGGSKAPLILLGAAAAAGGGIAVAKGGGGTTGSSGAPMSAPTPTPTVSGPDDIAFQGSRPPPGSTISRARRESITMSFAVVSPVELQSVDLHVELGYASCAPLSGCNCWIGVTTFSLIAGQPRTIEVIVPAEPHAGRPCNFPTTTFSVGARVVRSAGANVGELFRRQFNVTYTIAP